MPRYVKCLILTAVLCLARPALASDAEEQRAVAGRFLSAYLRQDMKTTMACVPIAGENILGPFPFTATPSLGRVRLSDSMAAVEFTGRVRDPRFHGKGHVLLSKFESKWYVRNIVFCDKLPEFCEAMLKDLNKTDTRRMEEARGVARRFMDAWGRKSLTSMMSLWCRAVRLDKPPVTALSCRITSMKNETTAWKEPYIRYAASVTYKAGLLKRSTTVKGGLILVKEKGQWKVRQSEMVFDF